MAAGLTVTVIRSDSRNLVRETSTAGIREVSTWLGEALTYASSPPKDAATGADPAVFEAGPKKLGFTSALPLIGGQTGEGWLSKVEIKLGETCWTNESDPGVLYRCVHAPESVSAGVAVWCDWGASGCASKYFDEKTVARGVVDTNDTAVFGYYLSNSDSSVSSVGAAQRRLITAVDLRVTVANQSQGTPVNATVYKYFSINEWRRI
jgi:hypothetical protein